MIKSFEKVKSESTCQKRITICEIYDKEGNLLSRESNRCSPSGGVCHRLNVSQDKTNYDVNSNCNWIHAEVNAIYSVPKGCKPYKAVLHGHTFYCDACENLLRKHGVLELMISEQGDGIDK